ncbi:SRPBCC family protein [bacterium]|nr:MAG: SRPBCC family protein [bacterium]
MRGVSVSSTFRRPVRAVWTEASDPGRWGSFVEAFAGYGMRFNAAVTGGPKDPPAEGTQVAISKSGGSAVLDGRLVWWDPLRGFTVTAHAKGWFTGYHGTFTVKLSELDDDLTSAELSMRVVFLNRFVELASLLMPVGFLYRRRLDKVLAKLAPK